MIILKYLKEQIINEIMDIVKKIEKEKIKCLMKSRRKIDGDFSTESFLDGFDCGVETSIKILKDTLNKYKSNLSEQNIPKLGRTPNFEKIVSYKAYIEIINEVINKMRY